MPPIKPMLDDVELQLVQRIDTEEGQALVQHRVPGLEGDLLQRLGRRSTRITLAGVMAGPESSESLQTLRGKFHAAEPVPFVADIVTATRVDQVVIEELGVRELAGKPERFEYALTLREYITPPPAEQVEIEQEAATELDEEIEDDATDLNNDQVDDLVNERGVIEVQVDLGGGTDYSGVEVVVLEGAGTDAERVLARTGQQTDGLYRFEGIEAGSYTVRLELGGAEPGGAGPQEVEE